MAKTKELEILDGNVAKIEMTIDAKAAKAAYENTVRKFSTNLNIPGFRKGKVPRNIVEKYIGIEKIRHQTLEDIFPQHFSKFVQDKKIETVAQPYVETFDFNKDGSITLVIKVELKPEVVLGEYKKLELEYEEYKNHENAVEDELKSLQERFAQLKSIKGRKTKKDDVVTFDFEGTTGGKPIEGASAKGHTLDLAHSNFIPGFAQGLVGHEIGEEFTINLTFPENYHADELKGIEAEFKIKLLEIKEKEYPALDDELAKKITEGKIQTLEGLKEDIAKYFSGTEEKENQKRKEDAIFTKIMDEAKMDIQKTMIQREIEAVKNETQQRARLQGLSWDELVKREGAAKIDEQLEEEAIRRIKNTLVMEKIADKEKITIEQKDVVQEINEIAMMHGDKGKALIEEINKNPSSLQIVAQQAITKKVTNLLLNSNTFKVKTKKGKK